MHAREFPPARAHPAFDLTARVLQGPGRPDRRPCNSRLTMIREYSGRSELGQWSPKGWSRTGGAATDAERLAMTQSISAESRLRLFRGLYKIIGDSASALSRSDSATDKYRWGSTTPSALSTARKPPSPTVECQAAGEMRGRTVASG